MLNWARFAFFKYLALLNLCFAIAGDFVWAEDLSSQYREFLQQKDVLSAEELQKLRSHHVLIVRGFLDEFKREKSFHDQIVFFEKNNISYSIAPMASKWDEEKNASNLYDYLKTLQGEISKPLIVISHSRGGIVVLNTLLDNEDLHTYVAGWLSLQAPFEGTTAADKIVKSKLGSLIAKIYLRTLRISFNLVREFTHLFRDQFMLSHSDRVTTLLQTVPILTYGTEIQGLRPDNPNYYLHPTRGPFFIKGTDGLVDYASTFLTDRKGASADSVSEFGVDHLGLIRHRNSTSEERTRKTEALLGLLLQKMEKSAQMERIFDRDIVN